MTLLFLPLYSPELISMQRIAVSVHELGSGKHESDIVCAGIFTGGVPTDNADFQTSLRLRKVLILPTVTI